MWRIALLVALLVLTAALASAQRPEGYRKHEKEFQSFLTRLDAAQQEFHNGRPAQLEEIWSHKDDVTLAGGTGGAIEKGWPNVKKRLDMVTTHYTAGQQTNERVDVAVSGTFASVVQYEHITFKMPGQTQESKKSYRITMIFRYEPGGWRLVHRQADTQMQMQVTAP